jgi:pSer/pThr/pTyr-binding forkhead associated (FHA) protein
MGDTRTRKLETTPRDESFSDFLANQHAAIVVLSGNAAGNEFTLDQPKVSLGRGPDVDLAFDDSAMSREHVVFEFSDGGFRIRDLGSTNGTQVNDEVIKVANLDHGDRLRIGEHVFQFILEACEPTPKTYVLPDA